MFEFTTRPVGYLTVGGLAMVLGLSTGVGIGYFVGGSSTSKQDVVIIEQTVIQSADDNILAIPPLKELPVVEEAENIETAESSDAPETSDVLSASPAPWPELTQKIEAERREKKLTLAARQAAPDLEALAPEFPPEIVAELEPKAARIDRESAVWEANSVTVADPGGKPMIAIVIDDLGLNRRNTVRTIRLPGPLTLAFLTYAEDLKRQTSSAHAAGHELMVHFPMAPKNPDTNPGPNALRLGMSEKEIRSRLNWGLSRFKGYVGVNNHMGSAFTGDAKGMAVVMDEMSRRDVLFLDSVTTQHSAGRKAAAQAGVPFAARDVFLDNEIDAQHIDARLAEVERVALTQGYAIAIGHPHGATIDALIRWLPHLEAAGFVLVPVSMIIKHRRGA